MPNGQQPLHLLLLLLLLDGCAGLLFNESGLDLTSVQNACDVLKRPHLVCRVQQRKVGVLIF